MEQPFTLDVKIIDSNSQGDAEMVKFSRINIENEGLTKFFSPNEVRILQLLWEKGSMTSGDIRECTEGLSLACIAGTLDRLVKSGVVKRELLDTETKVKYLYKPAQTREEIGSQISERIIESLIDTFGDTVTDTLGKYKKE
ncbi:MAG: BlaI/MecI/CopY family transcriptional regulator [Thermoplasmata archaeon]|nr:MAG: BlaI/MecI/CopY family transcriptional regulator [Thermoplasmata archaeon]